MVLLLLWVQLVLTFLLLLGLWGQSGLELPWGQSGLELPWGQSGLVCLLPLDRLGQLVLLLLWDLWGLAFLLLPDLLLPWGRLGRLLLALLLGLWLPSHQLHQLDLSGLEDLAPQLVRSDLWGQLVLEQGIYTGRAYSSPCITHCCYYNTYNLKPPV